MLPEPAPHGSRLRGLASKVFFGVLRLTQYVSPRPTALVIRRLFAHTGRRTAAALLAQAPADVIATIDEHYDPHPDALLDVYTPSSAAEAGRALPTVVWTHGGAFVGGSKDELAGYLRMIADKGYTAVAVGYTRAPEAHHPTQLRQVMAALTYLQRHAERLHVDPRQLVLAGDSAGAHLTAQAAAAITTTGYAAQLDVSPAITPDELSGVVLCCGIYDLGRVDDASPLRDMFLTVMWAYSGKRNTRDDREFTSATRLADHVRASFPPTFLTVGNADPLRPHSEALATSLAEQGVEVDTLFYPAAHEPALGHEYQFDLDLEDARTALTRIVAFLRRCTTQP
jgi:acetyl esterase/lipase